MRSARTSAVMCLFPRASAHTPSLKPAFHQNASAFTQVLCGALAERSPGHDLMPFGLLLSLAGSLLDDLVRGYREPRHLLLIAERPHFRITAQVPDEHHMIHHDLLRPAGCSPKPAAARINLGSYRDRRPAAADPLPRAQPEQPQRTFLAGPLTHCRRVQPEKSEPECAQRDLNVWLGAAGPRRQTRDRRGNMRLARCLGPRLSPAAGDTDGDYPVD